MLFAYFLDEASRRLEKKVPALSAKVRKHLSDHLWPGNVRELSNFALATALGLSGMSNNDGQAMPSLPEQMSVFEESVIRSTLIKTAGDVKATLELLGIPRKTFYDKVSRHRINLNRLSRNVQLTHGCIRRKQWWAVQGSNLCPLRCQANRKRG